MDQFFTTDRLREAVDGTGHHADPIPAVGLMLSSTLSARTGTVGRPADVCFLHIIDADDVGVSIVPDVCAARHNGLRVRGVSRYL